MDNYIIIIGNIAIGAGIAFMLFGAFNLFRLKDFYPRILATSKIDTVGLLTLLIGVSIHNGISFFTGKVLLILVIILILNPMVAHIVVRSAYLSGYRVEGQLVDDAEIKGAKGE